MGKKTVEIQLEWVDVGADSAANSGLRGEIVWTELFYDCGVAYVTNRGSKGSPDGWWLLRLSPYSAAKRLGPEKRQIYIDLAKLRYGHLLSN